MKKFLLINLSPRRKGTSVMLANRCKAYLCTKGHDAELFHLYPSLSNPEKLFQAASQADALILCGPCYINTYPADTITLLEGLAQRPELLHGQDLYGIIQGGMPYVHTHESGLLMLKVFANKCNVCYKGGFVMGGGPMLNGQPVEKLPNAKRVIRQLNVFFYRVEKGEDVPIQVSEAAQMKLSGLACRLMAWLLNHRIDKDLKKHGIDWNQPSPYLE